MSRENVVPFRALMVFTFIMIVAPQAFVPALAPLRPAFIAAFVAAAAWIADRIGRTSLTVMAPEVRLVLVLGALALASVPTSYWPGGSVNVITDLFGKSVVIFFLVANVLNTPARLTSMLWLLVLSCTLPALTGIKNYLQGNLMATEPRIIGYEAGGLTGNPNDLALMLNIVIPLAVGLLLTTSSRRRRLILAGTIALCAAAIIVTLSRAGFIFLMVTAALYLKRFKALRVWGVLFLALLVLLMFTVDGFFLRMQTIFNAEASGSSLERRESAERALQVMLEHPLFGVGIGQNVLALNELGSFWTVVHNVYLQVGADLGIPGLIVYVLVVVSCLRSVRFAERVWRARPRTRARRGRRPSSRGVATGVDGESTANTAMYHIAQGLEISLIGFAVAAMFHPVAYHFYFYYLAGMAVAVKQLARRDIAGHAMPAAGPDVPERVAR